MTGKEFKEEQAKIRELRLYSNFKQARDLTLLLIKSLFQEHKFSKIVELFYSDICTPPEMFYLFEVAYALNELDYIDESETVYEYLLLHESNNLTVLNNLSHIKRSKNQLQEAFELIQRAYELGPQDETIASNYHQLLTILQEKDAIQQKFTTARDLLTNELVVGPFDLLVPGTIGRGRIGIGGLPSDK